MSRKEFFLLGTLALVQFTNIMDFMIIMPLGPQLIDLFKIGPKEFSLLVASYTYTAGFVNFMGIFFLDRYNRKSALLIAYIGFILGTLFCFFANSYELLLLARVLTGMFGGVLSSISFSILGDSIPIERRGTATGIVMISFPLATTLGVPAGLYFANIYTWNAPFLILVGLGSLVFAMILFFIPQMKSHFSNQSKNPFPILKNFLTNWNQIKALTLMAFMMFGQMSIIPFITLYSVGNIGIKNMELPYIYLFGGISNFVGMPLIGKLCDKIGFGKGFFIVVTLSLIPIFLITNVSGVSLIVWLICTTLFMLLVGGRIVPALSLITSTVLPQNRGSFMSFVSSIQQLFSGLAVTVSGFIVSKSITGELIGYNLVGYIAITCTIVSIPLDRKSVV